VPLAGTCTTAGAFGATQSHEQTLCIERTPIEPLVCRQSREARDVSLYLQTRYTWERNMNVPEIEFDWDEANIGHVARHSVLPEEAEQVILMTQ